PRRRGVSVADGGRGGRCARGGLRSAAAHPDRRRRSARWPGAAVGGDRTRDGRTARLGRARIGPLRQPEPLCRLARDGDPRRPGLRRRDDRARVRPWAAAGLVLAAASAASVGLWLAADATPPGAVGFADVSLPSRLAVSVEGSAIVRDHPLFGTGLGSWLHAFRPYQAPPVEG